jgi:hypothetical protein
MAMGPHIISSGELLGCMKSKLMVINKELSLEAAFFVINANDLVISHSVFLCSHIINLLASEGAPAGSDCCDLCNPISTAHNL